MRHSPLFLEREYMKKIKFWFQNARPVALPQSFMPAVVAFFLALRQPGFCWWLGILAIIGGCMAHLGMNLADDYFDYRKKETGFRDSLAREGIRARTSKCPYIISGEATVKQTLLAAVTFGILALIPGAVIIAFRGWVIVVIVIIAVILGESYSGEPLRLSYRGMGEPDIGVMFGPLLMLGVYYASCGHFSWDLAAPAVSMGLLVTNILYVHSVLDYEADRRAGKATLAALVRGRIGRMVVLAVFLFLPYGITTLLAAVGRISPWYLLVFLTLGWAVKLFTSMDTYTKHPEKPVTFRGWYGPMANWQMICEGKLDWFMFRWYLARNLLTAFALVYIAVSVGLALAG